MKRTLAASPLHNSLPGLLEAEGLRGWGTGLAALLGAGRGQG